MNGLITSWMRRDLLRRYFDSTWVSQYTGFDFCLTHDVAAAEARYDQLDEPTPIDGFEVGYSRIPYGLLGSDWWLSAEEGALVYNKYSLVTPEVTGDWGTLNGWALVTAGNLTPGFTPQVAAVGRLVQPYRPALGDELEMDPGTLVIALEAE